MESSPTVKHLNGDDDARPPKRLKPLNNEVPATYSEQVRKKLAATSRTGQACDRCKERKMKCDTDPIACLPCRSKRLRCFTTDRVTGQARERGQSDRAEGELMYLRDQLSLYESKYGPLRQDGTTPPSYPPTELAASSSAPIPSSRYVGWPAPHDNDPIHRGPVYGTKVDLLDCIIDVADFECDQMHAPKQGQLNFFNASRTSIVNTIFHHQEVSHLDFPTKDEALQSADHFLVIMSQYVPIVHSPSFKALVARFYDHPGSVSKAEKMQIVVMLAILAQQHATRNHASSEEKFKRAHRLLHYALGFYRDVYHDISLSAMQALAFLCVYFRNLPKPGVTWSFCHQILVRTLELQYHRDPDKIQLPPSETSPLAKELRKRVFHSIFGICVTTGCRVGLPAPWQFQHVDVPLPTPLKDTEISVDGILANRTGSCDFYPCLQLAKLLPLLTELYNSIISVRRAAGDYLRTVDALSTKIGAWRQDWDVLIKAEPRTLQLEVATLFMDQWTAEFQLTLHHPVCCTSKSPDALERNLEICHKAAKTLLSSFHKLNRDYKGADFTWHSVSTYAMAFSITLHVYRKRLARVSREKFDCICNELKGWVSLIAYADLVLRTGNLLSRIFEPRVTGLEDDYRKLVVEIPPPGPASSINTFQPVNGGLPKPNVKSEPSPAPGQLNGVPSQQLMPPSLSASASPYNQAPPSAISSPYNHAPPSANPSPYNHLPPPPLSSAWTQPSTHAPLSYQPASSLGPSYAQYTQTASLPPGPPAAPPGQYAQAVPVSLAPLLNDPNGTSFVSYPNHSQTQTQTIGPTTADYSMMAFSPNHYYDPSGGAMSWPTLNMPGQHQQE